MRFGALVWMVWMFCGAALAQERAQIVAFGQGEMRAAPDVAYITLGVSYATVDAESAVDEVKRRIEDLYETLGQEGVRADEVESSGLRLRPVGGGLRQAMFRASMQVEVQVFDIEAIGRILTETVVDGANAVGGWEADVRYDVLDRGRLEVAARQEAVADALSRAQDMAAAAGLTLGPIRKIRDRGETRGGTQQEPFVPGDVLVRAEVSVAFDVSPQAR